MALCINLHKSQHLVSRYLLTIFGNRLLKCLVHTHNDRSLSIEADVLDDFTTQLMQKKSDKWEIMRTRRKLNNEQERVTHQQNVKENELNIKYIDENQINALLRDAIEADNSSDINEILNECHKLETIPALSVLLQILSFFSHSGDKDTIVNVIKLCSKVNPALLKEYSYFKHYLAEVTWIKGNVNEAIGMFEDVYRQNVYLRRRIRSMLKYLMQDAITNRSEAALLNMIGFAERLVEDFRDFYPLACIWQSCFLSEWFTDQCIALDLLKRNDGLYKAISIQIPYVVTLALKNNHIEVVYRLLEVLLKWEQKSQYALILEALFDYRVRRGDLRGCSEIIQWSLKQDVPLSAVQQEKFVNLLLTFTSDSTQPITANVKSKLPSAPRIQFKF